MGAASWLKPGAGRSKALSVPVARHYFYRSDTCRLNATGVRARATTDAHTLGVSFIPADFPAPASHRLHTSSYVQPPVLTQNVNFDGDNNTVAGACYKQSLAPVLPSKSSILIKRPDRSQLGDQKKLPSQRATLINQFKKS